MNKKIPIERTCRSCRLGRIWGVWCFLLICCLTQNVFGATAAETLVVANTRMTGSVEIARYYMKQRHIPADHLVLTTLTTTEVMNRDEYNNDLKKPVLKKITEMHGEEIAAIVLIYGVPLKVLPPALDRQMAEKLTKLQNELKHLRESDADSPQIKDLERQIKAVAGTDKRAAVDSELSLVKAGSYPLSGWIANPYFLGFRHRTMRLTKDDVLLVCRLDGPDPKVVYRLINDSISAEKTGLHGIAYFDARWPQPQNSQEIKNGYQLYDASLYLAAKIAAKRMPVKIDKTPNLFPPGSAPQAALYAGWYSLGHYIDSFTWVTGAVGYHIASSECATLRNPKSDEWCVQMLKHGVAATIGPVYEPYVQGFPLPDLFFAALTSGKFNLGESYLLSLPYLSWQMVLVGDPLYQPFPPIKTIKK